MVLLLEELRRLRDGHRLEGRLVGWCQAFPELIESCGIGAWLCPVIDVTRRDDLDRRSTALKDLRDRRDAIVADQARIRSNLGAVPNNSELQRRYLSQLQQQENDLSALGAQIDAAQRAVAEADAAWKSYVQGLSL